MLRRTKVTLAVAAAAAVAGMGLAAQPALAASGTGARSATRAVACATCPSAGCDGYVDADGDGVCDNRAGRDCEGRADCVRHDGTTCGHAGRHCR